MDRPGYIMHCWICSERLIAVDTYKTSEYDKAGKRWITRWFDPDWVLAEHVRRSH